MAEATRLIQTNVGNNDVIDLDLSDLRKKRIRIDGDDNKILEINTSDIGILVRLNEMQPLLDKLSEEALKLTTLADQDLNDDNVFSDYANALKELDLQMRDLMDTLFQANVSEVCASDGSMFDAINGSTRWEILLGALIQLYDENIKREMAKSEPDNTNMKRVHYHTDKYVGK